MNTYLLFLLSTIGLLGYLSSLSQIKIYTYIFIALNSKLSSVRLFLDNVNAMCASYTGKYVLEDESFSPQGKDECTTCLCGKYPKALYCNTLDCESPVNRVSGHLFLTSLYIKSRQT